MIVTTQVQKKDQARCIRSQTEKVRVEDLTAKRDLRRGTNQRTDTIGGGGQEVKSGGTLAEAR